MTLPPLEVELSGGWQRTPHDSVLDWATAFALARQCGATHYLEERTRDSQRDLVYNYGKLEYATPPYFVMAVAFLKDPVIAKVTGRPKLATQVGFWSKLGLNCFVSMGDHPRGYVTPFEEAYRFGSKLEEIPELNLPCQ
jgi:hypothetical protein